MNWPLGYADLAPYYDIVEEYVGISGLAEGVYELPDGKFLPPMAFTCPRGAAAHTREAEIRAHRHHRTHGESHPPAERARRLSLLRSVRAQLCDALVFQFRVHDDG